MSAAAAMAESCSFKQALDSWTKPSLVHSLFWRQAGKSSEPLSASAAIFSRHTGVFFFIRLIV